ncbi:MAG: hypothetical protein ACOC9T_01935 [Myxococcota bacterium]
MNVKLQGLLNAAELIEQRYGPEALARVLQRCNEEVDARYRAGIAIEWHPMEELVEFLRVADDELGRGDGGLAIEAGAAGARKNLQGTFKQAFLWLANPGFALRRVAALWRQFNDRGEMRINELRDGFTEIEILDVDTPHYLFCCTITGWAMEVARASGRPKAKVHKELCRAKGDARCLWKLEWAPLGAGA